MQRRALQTVRRGAPDDGPVPEPSVPGVYWGVSDSGQVWLVYLTGGPTGGAIYEPYGSLAVCELRNDSIATTTFRSAEKTDGTMYRFTGRRTREGLVGAMEWVRVRTGAVKAVDHLVLKAIRARFLTGSVDALSGEYEAVRVSQESGDVYGFGVILVDTVDGVVGFLVEYEGGPGPLQTLAVDRAKDTLRLSWPLATRTEAATTLIRGDTLRFIGGDQRLIKRSALLELFVRADRSKCE